MILRSIVSNWRETMKRFLIERNIPGVDMLTIEQLRDAAAKSNEALAKLEGSVQWVHSYIVKDQTVCVYLADNEAAVKEHARLSGFPASTITEIHGVFDPMTAAA
jgi:hypothetical protein